MSSVPAEITREILLRLPVRSLARFRSVCKEWNSITKDPDFVAAHLDRARKSLPLSMVVIDFRSSSYSIIVLDNAPDPRPISSKSHPIRPDDWLTTSGHGLLCIARSDGSIDLLNPTTGESLTVPTPPNSANSIANAFLGFHPVTKQYKVVNFFETNMGFPKLGYEVYTVGCGSWRRIEDLDFYPRGVRHGISIKGTIYWTTIYEGSFQQNLGDCIVASFDIATEKPTKIRFPSVEIYGNKRAENFFLGSLLELEGCLGMAVLIFEDAEKSSRGKMDIWELGGSPKNEWVKKFSFFIPWEGCYTRPISVYDGKVFMESSYGSQKTVLSFMDLRSGSWKEIYTHITAADFFPFVESLTSLTNI